MSSRRQKQINHSIRREISDLLIHQVNDPRIHGLISVTEVDVSPDLKQAKVYISIMGDKQEKSEVFQGIISASEFLRRELGNRMRMRYIPRLIFERDDSMEKAEHLNQLIDRAAMESPDEQGL